jgi:hypothetical protein
MDFDRFLTDTARASDLSTLTNATMDAFAVWLNETPVRPWRGCTTRSVNGLLGRLKDLKSFVSWLWKEEIIDRRVKVPLPKLPQILSPFVLPTSSTSSLPATI